MGKLYSALILAALVVASRAEVTWQTNFDAAKQQAKKEDKVLLLDFTGSDWCGFCIRLKKAVWDKPEFAKFAEKSLVLVELDFPHNKKVPAEVKKQNEQLQNKYKIDGFPTIVVLDGEGKELGRMEGYEGDNVTSYIKRLEKIIEKKNDAKASPPCPFLYLEGLASHARGDFDSSGERVCAPVEKPSGTSGPHPQRPTDRKGKPRMDANSREWNWTKA
jgi:thioredoxin-related protein